MKVLVVGGTGVLGRHLLPRLIEKGYAVRSLARAGRQTGTDHLGIEWVAGDILAAESLCKAMAECDAVVHAATAIPKPGAEPNWETNNRIRTEGTANLIAACRASGTKRYIQQSIAHLAAAGSSEFLDETAPLKPTAVNGTAVDMEELVKASALNWTILRGGIFYGPYAGQESVWRSLARERKLIAPLDGCAFISLIHGADYAAAIAQALETDGMNSIFNVTDDEPVTYRELFERIAALEGAPPPETGGPQGWLSCRISNRKFRDATGWRPLFQTYRSGFV